MLDKDFQVQNENEFRPKPGSFSELRKRMIIPIGIIVVFLVFIMVWITPGSEPGMWIIVIILPAVLVFSTVRAIKKQEAAFYTFRLTVTPEGITREREGLQSIFIARNEITRIRKTKAGVITITGKSNVNAIVVFAGIERPEELERLLSAMAPIENYQTPWWQKLSMLLIFMLLAAVYVTLASDSIWISGMALLIFVAIMGWSIVAIYISRNVEQRVKRWGWLMILPLFSMILQWLSRWEL